MFDAEITAAATRLLDACKAAGVMVATAESCTGGLIAGALTEIAGSSAVVDRGFVTYSNAAKAAMRKALNRWSDVWVQRRSLRRAVAALTGAGRRPAANPPGGREGCVLNDRDIDRSAGDLTRPPPRPAGAIETVTPSVAASVAAASVRMGGNGSSSIMSSIS